ncbi:MAG: CotH kinase family protein [Anaerolineae bacterium]|nr:CotH kinase family protein [Anaerolineae bacterium]
MRKRSFALLLSLIALTSVLGVTVVGAQADRPAGWDDYSHSNDTDPDYAVVFPENAVNTISITISPENWQAMQADMTSLYGEFGVRGSGGGPGGMRPPGNGPGGQPPAGGGQPGGINFDDMFPDENPIWVDVDLTFNGQPWTNVGMRFKGNSSLSGTWGAGSLKLPFRLDFDKFEDTYPEIDNQRFFGFDGLSFSSNFRDTSYLHERVAADIFREAGVPSARTAFYAVYLDYGTGSQYLGLYTAVEMVDDTVIETQFADDSGNLYKPEGAAATFALGTYAEADFDKETNEDAADYSDVLALYTALHAESRLSDPAAWRAELEAVFDADGFMRWLAVNTVIQNWDTYGTMSHNFFLYNDPTTGQLTWIPWDNNEALAGGGGFGGGGFGNRGGGNNGALDLDSYTDQWPLIRFLMDDPVYQALYVDYVEEVANGAFEPTQMAERYQALHDLIAPYVLGSGDQPQDSQLDSAEAFESSLNTLIEHATSRYAAAMEYVNSQAGS